MLSPSVEAKVETMGRLTIRSIFSLGLGNRLQFQIKELCQLVGHVEPQRLFVAHELRQDFPEHSGLLFQLQNGKSAVGDCSLERVSHGLNFRRSSAHFKYLLTTVENGDAGLLRDSCGSRNGAAVRVRRSPNMFDGRRRGQVPRCRGDGGGTWHPEGVRFCLWSLECGRDA